MTPGAPTLLRSGGPQPTAAGLVVRHRAIVRLVEGVVRSVAGVSDLASSRNPFRDAIAVGEDEPLHVALRVRLYYGTAAQAAAGSIRDAVRERMAALAGLRVDRVDVVVAGFERPAGRER